MDKPRVGLLGLGHWGRNHLRVLGELGALHAAHDPDPERLGRAPEELQEATLEGLLARTDLDAVVIATPARTHFDLARQALLAGKDVLVEKPMTLERETGEELARLAAERGRVLMVGHVTLFHPAVEKLHALLQDGTLGEPRYLYSNRLNRGTVREEEDILWSFAPHDLAVFLHLLDAWPEEVVAHGGNYLSPDRADLTITHLTFAGGVKGHIFVSWLHPLKEHRLVVIGSRRMAVLVDGPGGGSLTLHAPADPPVFGVPAEPAEVTEVSFAAGEPLEREVRHFLDVVRDRTSPRTGAAHGLEVLTLLESARTSLATHRAVQPTRPAGPAS